MSRIANAWRALMGAEPEVVVREVEVPGAPANVETVKLYWLATTQYSFRCDLSPETAPVLSKHFLSCADAFAAVTVEKDLAHLAVNEGSFIRIGNRYFRPSDEVKAVVKPKRAKGAK